MKEEQKRFEMLTGEVTHYLQKLSYSDSRISQYRSAWQRISAFMKEQDWEYYTATVGEAFIYHLIGKRKYDDLDRWEKDIIQCANVVTEFLETGTVKFRRCQKFRDLPGAIGQTVKGYIAHRQSYGISRGTIEEYKHRFQHFLSYLEDNCINDVHFINQQLILHYAHQLGFCTTYVRHRNLSILKGYLRYLYDHGLTDTDCSRMVPKDKFVNQAKLPSPSVRNR